jgi:mitogen-activated protein kinase binding protein 1
MKINDATSLSFEQANGNSQVQFARGHNIVGKTTFYDMESDQSQKHILTACQDRSVRVYNTSTGKHSKTFKGSNSDDGTLIKVWLHRNWMPRRELQYYMY